jgi:hypothetical protein
VIELGLVFFNFGLSSSSCCFGFFGSFGSICSFCRSLRSLSFSAGGLQQSFFASFFIVNEKGGFGSAWNTSQTANLCLLTDSQ